MPAWGGCDKEEGFVPTPRPWACSDYLGREARGVKGRAQTCAY